MAKINPINLGKWVPGTPIPSQEVRAEFNNLYSLVNGNIDAENLKSNSVTTLKLVDESVTDAKIKDVSASKIKGKLSFGNLPDGIFNSSGGSVTGTITSTVATGVPVLKHYSDTEVLIYEGGTGENKTQLFVGGSQGLRLVRNNIVLFQINSDGVTIPKAFIVPGE